MTYIIAQPCEGVCNTACVEVCPVDCIYMPEGYSFSPEDKEAVKEMGEQLYIHPEECIDCGACQPECPVDAIFPDDEVPEKWKHFIVKNYERFGLKVRYNEPPEF
ncbi:MAG: ferredoxin family protein [Calditrichia bacterium]